MTVEHIKRFFSTPTIRLAAIHLAIIMLMSIAFSVVLYHASDRQLARPLPQFGGMNDSLMGRFNGDIRSAIEERFNQTRQELAVRLVWINITTLLLGGVVSYVLARWSLRPIEESMEAQMQFVSDASHELRTPLTVLQTSNEVALRKKKLTEKEARVLAAHNVEEVKKLRDLSNSLLDLLKDSNAPIALQPVDVQEVVSDALASVVEIAQEKDIVIEDTVPTMTIQTDRVLLTRIIVILLDNAVKYSYESTKVVVSAKKSGKKIMIQVADQGMGIHASDLPSVFDRFYRADKSRATIDTSGYGLGLSIAKKMAEQLGAVLSVKSTVGKGSVFTVELPSAISENHQ